MWRARIAQAGVLVTESLVLYMVAAALAALSGGHGPAWLVVLVAALGGFGLVRGLQRFDMRSTTLIVAGAVATVLGLLVLLTAAFDPTPALVSFAWLRGMISTPDAFLAQHWPRVWGTIIVCLAWSRGMTLAQRELRYPLVVASFSLGLLVVVGLLLIGQGSAARGAIDGAAMPYFMSGLFTLALVNNVRPGGGGVSAGGGPWIATLAGSVGALAAISAAIGLFPLGLLNRLLAPVGVVALRVLDAVIFVIAVPLALLAQALFGLITGGRPVEWPQPNRLASDGVEQFKNHTDKGGTGTALLLLLGKVVFLLLLIAVVGYVLWRLFRRLGGRGGGGGGGEVHEALTHEGGPGSDLGALMGALLGRFRRPEGKVEPDLPPGILALRRLYARALRRAEDSGTPRPAAATPREFAPALQRALGTPRAATLSERYAAARYGRLEPTRSEVTELERDTGG